MSAKTDPRVYDTFLIRESYVTNLEISPDGINTLLDFWTPEGAKHYVYTFVPEGNRVRVELTVTRLPHEDEGEGDEPVFVAETKDLAREKEEVF